MMLLKNNIYQKDVKKNTWICFLCLILEGSPKWAKPHFIWQSDYVSLNQPKFDFYRQDTVCSTVSHPTIPERSVTTTQTKLVKSTWTLGSYVTSEIKQNFPATSNAELQHSWAEGGLSRFWNQTQSQIRRIHEDELHDTSNSLTAGWMALGECSNLTLQNEFQT